MEQNIVIIGAGFGGMWSALAARRLISSHLKDIPAAALIHVVVIAPEPQLILRPILYEPDPATKVIPLSDLFHATGVQFIQGYADAIRVSEKKVDIVNSAGARSSQPYDRLIFAAGSRLVRPNIPGLREHGFSVDQLGDATELEAHLQNLSSVAPSLARNTVVVCGAGFTGIEVASEMSTRVRSILGQDADINIVLVTRGNEVGETLGSGPRPAIIQALRELKVEVKPGTTISAIDATGITTTSGDRIDTLTAIWTAGMEATLLAKQIPGKRDASGRLYVDHDLRLPSAKEVFITGDAACAVTDDKGNYSLMSCQHAMPLGRAAGHNAAADLLDIATIPYSQPAYLTCLDLGAHGAVVTNGWDRKVVFTGAWAKKVKKYINGSLIYPPDADQVKAFAAADPSHPTVTAQHLLTTSLSFISFFASRLA